MDRVSYISSKRELEVQIKTLEARCERFRSIILENVTSLDEKITDAYTNGRITYNDYNFIMGGSIVAEPKPAYEKPPLGIMPKNIWMHKRLNDILEAFIRYAEAGKLPPSAWLEECMELTKAIEELENLEKSKDI